MNYHQLAKQNSAAEFDIIYNIDNIKNSFKRNQKEDCYIIR